MGTPIQPTHPLTQTPTHQPILPSLPPSFPPNHLPPSKSLGQKHWLQSPSTPMSQSQLGDSILFKPYQPILWLKSVEERQEDYSFSKQTFSELYVYSIVMIHSRHLLGECGSAAPSRGVCVVPPPSPPPA